MTTPLSSLACSKAVDHTFWFRSLTVEADTRLPHELRERAEIERLRLVVEKLRRMLFGKLSIQLDQLELQIEEMEAIHAAFVSVPACDAQAD